MDSTPKPAEDAWSNLPVYDSGKKSMFSVVGNRLRRISRTWLYVALALVVSLTGVYLLSRLEVGARYSPKFPGLDVAQKARNCQRRHEVASIDIWNQSTVKFDHLKDDKFTYAPPIVPLCMCPLL
jgi:hypothetical protein